VGKKNKIGDYLAKLQERAKIVIDMPAGERGILNRQSRAERQNRTKYQN